MRPSKLLILLSMFLAQGCTDDRAPPTNEGPIRFATFNIAMGLDEAGSMAAALKSGADPRLKSLATVLQTVRPDVVLLNEFDYDPSVDAAALLNRNYLAVADDDREAITYDHDYRPPVNTGVDSGLDLDGNGVVGEPGDAWGFGRFPGQYGMLILSRFPIEEASIRSFQKLRWAQLPGALRPVNADGSFYYPDPVWNALRLSSKTHLDIPLSLEGRTIHLLASHPTPPVFDGPEDRNGKRNHDEVAFWADYISDPSADWIVDDDGELGGLAEDSAFIIAGDLNVDPLDSNADPGSITRLSDDPRVQADCIPRSEGGAEAAELQAGINLSHRGDPALDTSDFNDESVGNFRLDYLLPSRDLTVTSCGVFWPLSNSPHYRDATFSDHRLVWLDIRP